MFDAYHSLPQGFTLSCLSLPLFLASRHMLYFALKNQVSSSVTTGIPALQEYRDFMGELTFQGRVTAFHHFPGVFLSFSLLPLRNETNSSSHLMYSILAG